MRIRTRYHILAILLGVLSMSGCDTSSNVPFPGEKFFFEAYGSDGDQSGVDLLELPNGELLLLGNSVFNDRRRIYLVRTDRHGRVLSETLLGGPADVAMDLERTADGRFVILSRVELSPSDTEIKLLRITQEGVVADSVQFGFAGVMDYPETVTLLPDGGYMVTGRTLEGELDQAATDPDAVSNQLHIRLGSDLVVNPSFRQRYGIQNAHDAAVRVFMDGTRFCVFGHTNRQHGGSIDGNFDLQYYAIDNDSENPTDVSYLDNPVINTFAVDACEIPAQRGGGFAIIGTGIAPGGTTSLHVAKLNTPLAFDASDQQLHTVISAPSGSSVRAVAIAPSGHGTPGYLLLADETRAEGSRNILISKIDLSGAVQWSASLGSEREEDYGAAVLELNDGRILVLGTVEVGDNQSKMALFKLNDKGRLQE